MKILVIGASSFSGAAFSRFAEAKGAEVIRASLRNWSLPPLIPAEYVVNFAAENVVAPSWDFPQHYLVTNAVKMTQLFDYLVTDGSFNGGTVQRYLHVSTPEVYGNQKGQISEEAAYAPSTPYAVSRAAAEMMAKCYHAQYGLPVVFSRSCNVYGPGQQLYRLIPKLICCIRKREKFPLEGSGMSYRAYIYIDDLCAALWAVLMHGTAPHAYNISSQSLFRIREIVALVAHTMGVPFEDVVRYVEARPGQDEKYHLEDSKVRALGWRDKCTIEDGIEQTVRWVNQNWSTLKDQPLEHHIVI